MALIARSWLKRSSSRALHPAPLLCDRATLRRRIRERRVIHEEYRLAMMLMLKLMLE